VIRGGGLWVRDAKQAAALKSVKRYENPAWIQWCQLKERTHYRPPEPDRYIDPAKLHKGWSVFPRHWTDAQARDLMTDPDRRALRFTWTLRPYQLEAIEAWRRTRQGVIEAPCGAGKTAIGSAIVAETPTPALVLVHTRDLMAQWAERFAESHADTEIGLVGGGKDERDAEVVIATLQTLTRWDFDELIQWGKGRGLVVVDECHHIPAATFSECMLALNGRHRLGLTATPERADGLTGLLHDHLGPTVHRIDGGHLETIGATLTPRIRWVQTSWAPPMHSDPNERKQLIADDADRNGLILDLLQAEHTEGRRVLVLCDLKRHASDLAAHAIADGVPALAVTSSTTAKRRREAFQGFRDGRLSALFCTSLADEGLDLPELETVILATPCGNAAKVEQRIGRALRPRGGKGKPLVLDLVDSFGPYKGYQRRRAKLYRERGWL
jgi:superfamily II DNA or RNA helicase